VADLRAWWINGSSRREAPRDQHATVGRILVSTVVEILIPPGSRATVTVVGVRRGMKMSSRGLLRGLALAVLLAALSTNTARAANWLEMDFWLSGPRYNGVLPACDAEAALFKISSRFNMKENDFWNSDLRILGFEKIRETAFRPWAGNAIPRRFCSAMVTVSDGRRTAVHYSISEDTGMAGMTWGVEWCVVGLDRNWAYSPACKMARP
jgi:hypothetical protein